ncbi:conserved hypothetical protein [Theileria orientalis strain Shintoku]|uniref:Transmembrane protein n=1 Tax=Theileria orientalis strain Shintoku TaxID=869250 RepID=J4CDX8_THEOR|nr:conserved hypothetical protein [Theileria orientalis strain Shintoku]BAM41917.1 conserved hypothetical protein [Theileria orientalis strain Shintoku]|eukprot:XP_009692218.1 conserved hypothetical protein [Theileria orientalis strain Shintoku]
MLKRLLYVLKPVRFKTNLATTQTCTNLSNFTVKVRRRFLNDVYFDLEDEYKRISRYFCLFYSLFRRSTKYSHYGLGMFILIPTGLALFSPSTPSFVNLLSHQFKVSSLALCWLSSNYLAFNLCRFGRSSLLANSRCVVVIAHIFRGFVGLAFAIAGIAGTLIIGDYNIISGLYSLLGCYALLGSYNYLLAHNKLLPRSIFIPSSGLILFNLAAISLCIIKSHFVKEDLTTTSHEEIVRRFESSKLFKKTLAKSENEQK